MGAFIGCFAFLLEICPGGAHRGVWVRREN